MVSRKSSRSKQMSFYSTDMAQRQNPLPSDILTDAWSDLASEFSDTKLRKNPNIRTSTPNITRHSSSLSSKEVIQMRKQLNSSSK